MDVYEELVIVKMRKKEIKKCKKIVGVGSGMGEGVGWGGGGGWLVARLGVVGDVQYWGCKPRIEGIVKCS